MKLTGLSIRNKIIMKDIETLIKELEIKRTEEDLLNRNKFDSLYEVYYKLKFYFDWEV